MALDFIKITETHNDRQKKIVIAPEFLCKKSKDLMIRGGGFYAVWDEEGKTWLTDIEDCYELIDKEINLYLKEHGIDADNPAYQVKYASSFGSSVALQFITYTTKTLQDRYKDLDAKLIFLSDPKVRENYSTRRRLNYDVVKGECPAYDELMNVLYAPEEREKIEWGIGSILAGDSQKIQKFFVLYGAMGTGKSTVINIIQQLFDGYYDIFDAAALGDSRNTFAMEPFKNNPLVAIQHDGDLSKIEDNTRLNSIVSHETMKINEKYKGLYNLKIRSMLFIGTNKPVKITDAKSGLLRRLIDVTPTGNKLPIDRYEEIVDKIPFELGAIAYRCRELYLSEPKLYNSYRPMSMMSQTNDFYNFVLENFDAFESQEYVTLKSAWAMYKEYCESALVPHPLQMMKFAAELNNYFEEGRHDEYIPDSEGRRIHMSSIYRGFKTDIFKADKSKAVRQSRKAMKEAKVPDWLNLRPSEMDMLLNYMADWKAQYSFVDSFGNERPKRKWDNCETTLKDIRPDQLHYVLVKDPHYIFVDFDLKDENGQKSFAKNIEAAAKFPPTYTEVSKGGNGLHLHYIYDGDPGDLSAIYDEGIEIKVMTGNSSIRRRLSLCNNLKMAHINSGLPLKSDISKYGKDRGSMLDYEIFHNEKALRALIRNCIEKKHHGYTKPEVDYIKDVLDKVYEAGVKYDVTDLRPTVMEFASRSSNKADYCMSLVCDMHFKSDDPSENKEDKSDKPIIFYDVEVFPNLFVVCYKVQGPGGKETVRALINPSSNDIQLLIESGKLVGFNNRDYDNHILYGRMLGYDNERLYELSQRIIEKSKNSKFGEAYNLSYTDIFDFSNDKKSLKKWEIELGIHHQELGLPWDKPVPEELWDTVADYCKNDVVATEAVWNHLAADWSARQLLAKLSGLTVNDTTNSHTTKIIFGNNRHPQSEFKYTDLSEMFPGYKYEFGKSTYRGEETGEGGYVYSEPGIYYNVALLDVASMHPSSLEALELFGPYTKRFSEIKQARICVKHKDLDGLKDKLNGELLNYIPKSDDPSFADYLKNLAYALKIVINSVYGLTSAKFDNPFKDPRNVDNIVAKRGALFMINLKHEVQKRGYTVAHIKTDSIKIPNADIEIINFVFEYGKRYGYTFEHEATYAKMCLVNDAVYIAKYGSKEACESLYGYIPDDNAKKGGKWTATGAEFAVPYIFKTLFSHEPIEFEDLCETKSVSSGSALYLDCNEDVCQNLPELEKDKKRIEARYKSALKKGTANDFVELDNGVIVLRDDAEHYKLLCQTISDCHDYVFVGRTGQFTPVNPGVGGGELLREKDGKYAFAAGAKGWRWLESEDLRGKDREADIDMDYFRSLVDSAIADIAKFGDANAFIDE